MSIDNQTALCVYKMMRDNEKVVKIAEWKISHSIKSNKDNQTYWSEGKKNNFNLKYSLF